MSTKSITRAAGGAMPSAASASAQAARSSRSVSGPSVLNISRPFTRSTRCHSGNTVSGRECQWSARFDQIRSNAPPGNGSAAKSACATRGPRWPSARPSDAGSQRRQLVCSTSRWPARASIAPDRSTPNTGASGKRARSAGRSSPGPQPASSTAAGLTLMYSRRSFIRCAISRGRNATASNVAARRSKIRRRRRVSLAGRPVEVEAGDMSGTLAKSPKYTRSPRKLH